MGDLKKTWLVVTISAINDTIKARIPEIGNAICNAIHPRKNNLVTQDLFPPVNSEKYLNPMNTHQSSEIIYGLRNFIGNANKFSKKKNRNIFK